MKYTMPHLLSPYVNDWVAELHPEWRAAILDKNLPLRAAFNKAVEELAKFLVSKSITKELIEKYGLAKFITPAPNDILNAFKVPGITKTQFVICGQDPYPTPGIAQGFCFSTKQRVVPESLKNIFAALVKSKAVSETPTNPDFELWTRQGWLINRYLTKHYDFEIDDGITCKATKDKKCHTFWADFTDLALSYLVEEKTKSPGHLAIMLWGEPAKKLAPPILSLLAKKGKIIEQKYWLTRYEINLETGKRLIDIMSWGHPSPLGPKDFPDCPHFAEINKIRAELSLPNIHWNTNYLQPVFVATDGNCPKNGQNPDKAVAGYYLPDKFMHIKQTGKTEAVRLQRFEYQLKDGKIVTTDTPAPITNNRVELLALCNAIHYILRVYTDIMPPVRIIVDSTYALNTAQLWIWQKKIKYGNNWLDKIDANKDLIVILANLLARLAVRYGGAMKSAQHQWNILIHPEAKVQNAGHVDYDVYSRWPRLLIWHQASHTQLDSTASTFQRACHMVNDCADKACNALM